MSRAQRNSGPAQGKSESGFVANAAHNTPSVKRLRSISNVNTLAKGTGPKTIAERRAAAKEEKSTPVQQVGERPKLVPDAVGKGPTQGRPPAAPKKTRGEGGGDGNDESDAGSDSGTSAWEKSANSSYSSSESEDEDEDDVSKGGKAGNPFKGGQQQQQRQEGQPRQRLRDGDAASKDLRRNIIRTFFRHRFALLRMLDQEFNDAEGFYNTIIADLVWASPTDPWAPAMEQVDWTALGLDKNKNKADNKGWRKPSPEENALVMAEGTKVFKEPLFNADQTRRLLMWMQHIVGQDKKVAKQLEARGIFGDDQQPPPSQLMAQPPEVQGMMRVLHDVRTMGRQSFELGVRLSAHIPLVTGAGGLLEEEKQQRLKKYMNKMEKKARGVRQGLAEILSYLQQAQVEGMGWDAVGMGDWDRATVEILVLRGRAGSLLWLEAFESQQRRQLKEAWDARLPALPKGARGGQPLMQKKIMASLKAKQDAEARKALGQKRWEREDGGQSPEPEPPKTPTPTSRRPGTKAAQRR